MRERWGAGQVTIRGLANSQASLDRLVAALTTAAAPMAVVPEVRIVAGVAEARQAREAGAREVAALAGLTARVDAIEAGLARTSAAVEKAAGAAEGARSEAAAGIAAVRAEAGAETAQLEAAISGAEARAKDARQSLAGEAEARSSRQGAEISALRGELEAVRARLSAPGRRIAEAAQASVVFFHEAGDALADPSAAGATLDALAQAIRETGLGVRVVGFADDTGSVAGNIEISRQRAQRVAKMLIERGAPAGELVPVGRGAQTPIGESTPDGRARNRRVVFEPLFPGEQAP